MPAKKQNIVAELLRTWTLPPRATLGSSVRARGILLELRARLPFTVRKSLDLKGMDLTLAMPQEDEETFLSAAALLSKSLEDIEDLPVIPREIEDILSISTSERRRWLDDGRLTSAGTRTVRLRGRARQITFHVFDPRLVEDLLDRGAAEEWREVDAAAATENRRRAAWKAKLTRSLRQGREASKPGESAEDAGASDLAGWEAFRRDGFLR